jgi:Type I restriction enzyme R protein N terminus (HSDR_N)
MLYNLKTIFYDLFFICRSPFFNLQFGASGPIRKRFKEPLEANKGHHLILGEEIDFITGCTILDTHDERYRQLLARLLVEQKGYPKKDIEARRELFFKAADKTAMIKIDYTISLCDKICMIVKYGPGSLTTRHRPALAASRLLALCPVPVVVVTNGKDADIINGSTGTIIGRGLESIPSKSELIEMAEKSRFDRLTDKQIEMEARILYAFEVDDSCPCDDTICRL